MWKLVIWRRRVDFSLVLVVAIALAGFVGINTHLTASEAVSGHVTHVRDGDTIEVDGRPIRLQGLNCAERGTRLGEAATAAIRRLVSGQSLTCELNGERTYDREVGRCYLPSGYDVAAVLISLGVCGRCARYDPIRKYVGVQAKAGPYQGDVPGYCRAPW